MRRNPQQSPVVSVCLTFELASRSSKCMGLGHKTEAAYRD